jgi:glycosyltransferase involved in cell wall biosynthesis
MVFYIHQPSDEGRKWSDTHTNKNYTAIQLENKKVGPEFLSINLNKTLLPHVKEEDTVIFQDNLPTNLAMLNIVSKIKRIIPEKRRYLWIEHIYVPEQQKGFIPFYREIKQFYKYLGTWLLAYSCGTILPFSDMSVEYTKKVGLPLAGQTVLRAYQAIYTEEEQQYIAKQSQQQRKNYDPESITFGYLGYLNERKRIDSIIKAFSMFKDKNASLIFAGDGEEKATILAAIKNDSRISYHPYVKTEEEKGTIFNTFDVQVLASDKDPWGLIVNEAATRGVPTIVSPNVGAKEMMKEISSKLLLINNDPISITKAFYDFAKLKANKLQWQKLQDKTEKVALEWSIEKAAKVFTALVK